MFLAPSENFKSGEFAGNYSTYGMAMYRLSTNWGEWFARPGVGVTPKTPSAVPRMGASKVLAGQLVRAYDGCPGLYNGPQCYTFGQFFPGSACALLLSDYDYGARGNCLLKVKAKAGSAACTGGGCMDMSIAVGCSDIIGGDLDEPISGGEHDGWQLETTWRPAWSDSTGNWQAAAVTILLPFDPPVKGRLKLSADPDAVKSVFAQSVESGATWDPSGIFGSNSSMALDGARLLDPAGLTFARLGIAGD